MTALTSETVVLASTSTTRISLLESAGVAIEAVAPRIDEDEIKQALVAQNVSGAAISEVLAEQKARYVSRQRPQALVIGADQILEMDDRIYSKPRNLEAAREQLIELRGQEHRLHSCVCVLRGEERLWHQLDSARLTMRNFSDAFLDAYLTTMGDQALAGPGSYRLEDVGSQLFSRVSGDYFTILGLPLIPLLDYLRIQRILPS